MRSLVNKIFIALERWIQTIKKCEPNSKYVYQLPYYNLYMASYFKITCPKSQLNKRLNEGEIADLCSICKAWIKSMIEEWQIC